MASPILQSALKDGCGEDVVTYDMPEPCGFLSLDSWQKWFLSADEEVNPAPHPVIGLVLYVEHMDTFPQALSLKSLDLFLEVSKQGPCLTAIEEDGGNKRMYNLNFRLSCFARPCFIWPLLPSLRRSLCGFLWNECHPCTKLLSGT